MKEREEPTPPEPVIRALSDGTPVRIRPLRASDGVRIKEGLERLSPESRRQRFLTPLDHLTEEEIEYFANPDGIDHLGLGMELVPEHDGAAPLGIGVARCVRMEEGDLAEMAIIITDEFQGLGAGTVLLTELARWSIRAGMPRWLGLILADNQAIRRVLERVGDEVSASSLGEGVISAVYELKTPPPIPDKPLP